MSASLPERPPGRRTATPARIWLGEIAPRSAAIAVTEIEAAPPGALRLFVDSPGGDLDAAFDVARALQRRSGPTEAIVLRAESAAIVPTVSCGAVSMAEDGHLLLHAVGLFAAGVTVHDLADVTKILRSEEQRIADLLAHHSGRERPSFFKYLMNLNGGAGTKLAPQSALSYGVADRIVPFASDHIRRMGRLP